MIKRGFKLGPVDAIDVYSSPEAVWLQVRRNIASAREVSNPSYKIAVPLTPKQANELAGLLTKAAAEAPNLKGPAKLKRSIKG